MPPSSLGSRLRWLARYASSLPEKAPSSSSSLQKPFRRLPKPSPFAQCQARKFPIDETIAEFQSPPLYRPIKWFRYRYDWFRGEWNDFKSKFNPKFRRDVYIAVWFLPWLPIMFWVSSECFTVMNVKGPSMYPTLNRDLRKDEPYTNDKVLVNLLRSGYRGVKRGEVVVFRSPLDPERAVIKRVVAVPGDMVYPLPPYPRDPLIIQWGQIWVEGDNNGTDSVTKESMTRDSNTYGPIPAGLVVGHVVGVVWPWWNINFDLSAKMKDNPRVLKKAVALRDPDEVSAEREAYWRDQKLKGSQDTSGKSGSDIADGEAGLRAIREIETS